MRKIISGFILALAVTSVAASEGMIVVPSAHSVADTGDRLEAILKGKGMTVFARVDHAAGARKAGKSMPPTELLIFGNPKVGTPLMLCSPDIAIDLPQKALIWQDTGGDTWIAYNDPQYLKLRHNTQGCDEVFDKVAAALANFAAKAGAAE